MKIGKLDIKLSIKPNLGEHFEISLKNTDAKEYFTYDPESDSIKIRLTTDTALLLSDFIDDAVDEMLTNNMKVGV